MIPSKVDNNMEGGAVFTSKDVALDVRLTVRDTPHEPLEHFKLLSGALLSLHF